MLLRFSGFVVEVVRDTMRNDLAHNLFFANGGAADPAPVVRRRVEDDGELSSFSNLVPVLQGELPNTRSVHAVDEVSDVHGRPIEYHLQDVVTWQDVGGLGAMFVPIVRQAHSHDFLDCEGPLGPTVHSCSVLRCRNAEALVLPREVDFELHLCLLDLHKPAVAALALRRVVLCHFLGLPNHHDAAQLAFQVVDFCLLTSTLPLRQTEAAGVATPDAAVDIMRAIRSEH
mmetsp:Transcript_102042/g.327431  ORF Transcript_102042/g.327431 Transcript_102042/m.327431 type:complete len:229 (-) Transcript_102042:3058-3744(-)